jgi:hypothetical protein
MSPPFDPLRAIPLEPASIATPKKIALIVYGPGRTNRLTALELAGRFCRGGWAALTSDARAARNATGSTDLVIAIDAKADACRVAVSQGAPVLVADESGRVLIDRLLAGNHEGLTLCSAHIGTIRLDGGEPVPIVHRAVVAGLTANTALSCTSAVLDTAPTIQPVQVCLDVPEMLPHTPGRDAGASRPRPTVLTTRTPYESQSVFLQPDETYTVTAADGTDVVAHVDEHLHQRARRVELAAHPVGLRVLTRRTASVRADDAPRSRRS